MKNVLTLRKRIYLKNKKITKPKNNFNTFKTIKGNIFKKW
jgi:hypothetical protein